MHRGAPTAPWRVAEWEQKTLEWATSPVAFHTTSADDEVASNVGAVVFLVLLACVCASDLVRRITPVRGGRSDVE